MEDTSIPTGPCNLHRSQLIRCPIQFRPVMKETMDYLMFKDSIRDVGILQSLLVRPVGDIGEVVDGNNRFEIACDIRLELIPCLVRHITDDQVRIFQMIANSRIATPSVADIRRLQQIIHNHEMTVEQLAYSVHKHPDQVRKLLSLNYLSPTAKRLIDKRKLSCTIGIELARLPIDRQDQLLSLKDQHSAKDYLELLREEVRYLRINRKEQRISSKANDNRSMRQFSEVKKEHIEKIEKGIILTRYDAKNASDGWDACMQWVLSVDSHTLAERMSRKERRLKLDAKRKELRNLELKRRLSDE